MSKNKEVVKIYANLIYAIWENHNKQLHMQPIISTNVICEISLSCIDSNIKNWDAMGNLPTEPNVNWSLPPWSWIKLNFDGSIL